MAVKAEKTDGGPYWPGGCHIGDCWVNNKFCFSCACLNNCCSPFDSRNKSYKTEKSNESSIRNSKFTHNIDYDMIKIIR